MQSPQNNPPVPHRSKSYLLQHSSHMQSPLTFHGQALLMFTVIELSGFPLRPALSCGYICSAGTWACHCLHSILCSKSPKLIFLPMLGSLMWLHSVHWTLIVSLCNFSAITTSYRESFCYSETFFPSSHVLLFCLSYPARNCRFFYSCEFCFIKYSI